MYFWKVDQLVEDFKSGNVSQKEEFKYMLLFTVLMVFATDPFLYIGSSYNFYDSINSISLLITSAWGIYYCYTTNSAGDNKDFIVRVMCIGLPIVIRLVVFFIPIFVLEVSFDEAFSDNPIEKESRVEVYETSIYTVVTTVIFIVLYYVYLAKKIRAVSS